MMTNTVVVIDQLWWMIIHKEKNQGHVFERKKRKKK
jgi:hypothetical protein